MGLLCCFVFCEEKKISPGLPARQQSVCIYRAVKMLFRGESEAKGEIKRKGLSLSGRFFQHPGAGLSRRGRNLSFLAYAFFFLQ